MDVSSEAVLFTIKAFIRLGTAARKSYEDTVVGEDIELANLDLEPIDASQEAALRFEHALSRDQLDDLDQDQRDAIQKDLQIVFGDIKTTADDRFKAGRQLVRRAEKRYPDLHLGTDQGNGIWIIKQWKPGDGPPAPIARMGLALVDVGLEYVAAHPSVIGAGGNADKLIAGVAANLADLLPEPDKLKEFEIDFAEKAIRIFVRASLMALEQHADTILEKDSVRELSRAVLSPLIKKVSAESTGTQRWYDIRDELLGPISEAAIGVIAKHQGALLGKTFEKDTAIGAVTNSALLAIKENGIEDDFGREGVTRIYKAALEVAITRPGLFVGEIEGTDIGQQLLKDAAKVIKEKAPPFNSALATELTAVAIESVGKNAPSLFAYTGDWGKLTTEAVNTVITEVSEGLAEGVREGKADIFGRLFNAEQANRFFKIIVASAAANPGMITGKDSSQELKWVTKTLAQVMSEQNKLLLTSEDWINVASALTKEVARNPNRLIKIDASIPENQLAYAIISKVLFAAADNFKDIGRAGGCVLFGSTLAEVVNDSLEAAAGNAGRAAENADALEKLVIELNRFNSENPGRIGRREWRFLFRLLVADALETGEVPKYTDNQLFELLKNA